MNDTGQSLSFRTLKLRYKPEQREKWPAKEMPLQRRWAKKYRTAFDVDDFILALGQPSLHFGEWFVARDYAKRGYNVLVEKYRCKSHARKWKTFRKILGSGKVKLLKRILLSKPRRTQPPDLFVYNGKERFFVEVKVFPDDLSDAQKAHFRRIQDELGYDVIIADVRTHGQSKSD